MGLGQYSMAPAFTGILREATALIASGKLYVPVAATYPLSAIKDAVAHVERGGKVLLDTQKGRNCTAQ